MLFFNEIGFGGSDTPSQRGNTQVPTRNSSSGHVGFTKIGDRQYGSPKQDSLMIRAPLWYPEFRKPPCKLRSLTLRFMVLNCTCNQVRALKGLIRWLISTVIIG